MRIPQSPPSFRAVLDTPEKAGEFLALLTKPEVSEFVTEANDAYLPWDKLRRYRLPEGLTPEMAWAALEISRAGMRHPLPLSFVQLGQPLKYAIFPKHLEWLHKIDQRAGGTIGASKYFSQDDEERYLYSSLMEEAIASSQLEGASTTRRVAKKMLIENRRPRTKSEQMIINNYHAILEIRDMLKDELTPEMMLHLQEILVKDASDHPDIGGRFRTVNEEVYVQDGRTGEVIHRPPSAESIPQRLQEICEFANGDDKPFIHPVIKAMVLHFAIGFVHPFVDGNGRTARAIFYWYMLKKGYWLFEYLSVSRILVSKPSQYVRAYLYTETDGGDTTYFNHFHLRVILQAISDLHKYLQSKQREVKAASRWLASYPDLNYRQIAFVSECFKHPTQRYTIKEYENLYRVAYATARSDLLTLEQRGLLKSVKRGKRMEFYAPDDLSQRIRKGSADSGINMDETPKHKPKLPNPTARTVVKGKQNREEE